VGYTGRAPKVRTPPPSGDADEIVDHVRILSGELLGTLHQLFPPVVVERVVVERIPARLPVLCRLGVHRWKAPRGESPDVREDILWTLPTVERCGRCGTWRNPAGQTVRTPA
jgi:hypothetical protein